MSAPGCSRPELVDEPADEFAVVFDQSGLVPVIAQQWDTGEVLMLAWMDQEALRRTRSTGQATYWSRSRQQYWVKGSTSGNTQHLHEVKIDCDGDALLLLVDQTGPACHTGTRSCFDRGVIPLIDQVQAHGSGGTGVDHG